MKDKCGISEEIDEFREKLVKDDKDDETYKNNWQKMRQLFALASMELMKYDFVIMDEFQNFSEILNKANATKAKKASYYDKAKYILSVLKEVNRDVYGALISYIEESFGIRDTIQLSEADKVFWRENLGSLDEKMDIDALISVFSDTTKKRLKYPSDASIKNEEDSAKEQMLQLAKCIISRKDKESFVNNSYYNISGEFFTSGRVESIELKSKEKKTTTEVYCSDAKSKNELLGWWEQDKFEKSYQELRNQQIDLGNNPKKKVPFRYLLNIHFANKDDKTNIANTIFNCFMHFIEDRDKKMYLWQYAYLLTHQLAEDSNRLNYIIQQLEPMRVFLGKYIIKKEYSNDFDNDCENIVIEKIFNNEFSDGKYTKIMMLSATPFRMYVDKSSSLDEDVNVIEVCDFLDTNAKKGLGKKLIEYKKELLDFSRQQNKVVVDVMEKKDSFQINMNSVFTRMERFAVLRELDENWFENQANTDKKDELPCGKIKELVEYLKQVREISEEGSVITYAEDAPYMGTFMHAGRGEGKGKDKDEEKDGYKWKRNFNEKISNGEILYSEDSYVYLSNQCFKRKEKALGQWHGIYEASLGKILDFNALENIDRMNHPGAARLLWVPSCVGKNKLEGVFKEHKDYGKTIIFSRLVQVPRMIAGLTSYETLRRLVWKIEQNIDDMAIFDMLLENLSVKDDDIASLSTYQKLNKILESVLEKIKTCLKEDETDDGIKAICQASLKNYCDKYWEKFGFKEDQRNINENAFKKLVDSFVDKLINNVLLNRHQGMFAIWASKGFYVPSLETKSDNLIEEFVKDCACKVLEYCKDGCLGDVLDEWLYICLESEQDIGQFLGVKADKNDKLDCLSFVKSTALTVSLYENDNGKAKETKSGHIDTYFARCIGMSQDDDKISTIKGLQQSFNAPFAPFVFATTSMGQEGLDFHYFADKIIHWRLPSNPVDFEQREGRINRYHCLALRKKLIEWYGNEDGDAYEKFEKALEKAKSSLLLSDAEPSEKNPVVNCGLIPDWILMNPEKSETVSIKRYVPYFYLSKTNEDFNKNLMVLQLYRSVIGQTDPEEVMERLMNDKEIGDVKSLFVDFSPYNVN